MEQQLSLVSEDDSNINCHPTSIDIAFRSGMSRSNDLRAAIMGNIPVGVVAGELRQLQVSITLPKYLAAGGKVFIDSGAFTSFKTGIAPNFNEVLRVYEGVVSTTLLLSTSLNGLYVVSPDKVGDQVETLRLLGIYQERLNMLINQGCQLIIPIQCGAMPVSQMLSGAINALGTNRFIVGIPSNEAAMTIAECATLRHHAFHILGRVQQDDEQVKRILAINNGNPGARLTADANWLRSRIAIISELNNVERLSRIRRNEISGQSEKNENSARTVAVLAAIKQEGTWGSGIGICY